MNVCGKGCGYCGRCDDEARPESIKCLACATCGVPIVSRACSVAGVVVFCGEGCKRVALAAKAASAA